jgi:hypothetical protein
VTRRGFSSVRILGFAALLNVLALLFLIPHEALAQKSSSAGKSAAGLSSLPANAQGPVSAALGRDDSGYWVHVTAKGLRGENPRQVLTTEFTRKGAEVRGHSLRWALETRGYGYGSALHPVKAVDPVVKANRVEYRRDGITEWYENGPLGLEQGFALAHPPGKANGQPLTLELRLHGDFVAALDPGRRALELRGKDGKAALRYLGLSARDATGRELRSWLETRGTRLLVFVEDETARYPVVIDPWVQYVELLASDGAAGDNFGYSVAVSGSTIVVGAVGSNQDDGAAYVFVESGGTWTQQAELTASDGASYDHFGESVAVSRGTVVVGAPDGGGGGGRAYVFVQNGATWSQQAELAASDSSLSDQFGYSVAVSDSTALVGAPHHAVGGDTGQGAAYVFVESGGTWSQQAELTASDGAAGDQFGWSVAVSGSTAVVGADDHTVGSNTQQGAAYVFVQSGTMWSQQAELISSDGAAGDSFGWSVSLDGSTAVVGADTKTVGSNSNQGAAYVFVQSGNSWGQQAELIASDGAAGNYFGWSVALSGSTAVVGAPNHSGPNLYQGAAYVFVPTATTVTLTPASLNFGDQAVDTSSAAKTVTLKNTGTATLDISGIALTVGTNFTISSKTCGSTLAVNKTCKVSVTFTPTALGALSDTLSFTDNASGSPQTVSLSGTGVAQATLTPASHTFPKTKVGDTSAAYKFTLENNLPTTLTGISYSTAAPFAVSASTCGTTLDSKKSCTISVTFSPTANGKATGTLSVSDSANDSPQTASLAGTGD